MGQEKRKLREMPEDYWRERLTPEEYAVLREGATEPAFTGAYHDIHEKGVYRCRACGAALFSSEVKYDSGTGWPSFWEAADPEAVEIRDDTSHGMRRTEVICRRCGSHLGHLFPDGPEPTGTRYCINSCALRLDPEPEQATLRSRNGARGAGAPSRARTERATGVREASRSERKRSAATERTGSESDETRGEGRSNG